MNEPTRPASWYADPTGRHQYRYWSGTEWTDQVADNQVTSTDPPTMAADPGAPTASAPGAPPGAAPIAPKLNDPNQRRSSNPIGPAIAALGGLALAIGSFLDSDTISGLGASVGTSYMEGDGPLTLGLGIAVMVLAILLMVRVLPRWGGWVVAFLGGLGALIALADIVSVSDSPELATLGVTRSVGPALWICVAGGIAALVGGGIAALLSHSESD